MTHEILQSNTGVGMEAMLAARMREPEEWTPPTFFDLSNEVDETRLKDLMENGAVESVVDNIDLIAEELYELEYPDKKDDVELKEEFTGAIREQGVAYGKWVFFPWSKELVRYPDKDEHRALHTSRFKNLTTDSQQSRLYDSTVVVFGLSVGSSVGESLVGAGIGGRIITGDPDHVSPTNLGRIKAKFSDVGTDKIDLMARKISEADPYIEQMLLRDGFTQESLGALALLPQLDVLFDEVDNLRAKAQMRKFAREKRVAVVMATDVGERSIIDVERYDVEDDVQPFNGKLEEAELTALLDGKLDRQTMSALTLKIVGIENVSERMMQSYMEVGKTLPGIPQLGVTATMGGALASIAAREIILGHNLPSGRYVFSADNVLNIAADTDSSNA